MSSSQSMFLTLSDHVRDSIQKKNRILVYSHDTFGLGNIRRMLSICERLLADDPDTSILLITGSPMIHDMRVSKRLDYIKLPCLSRNSNNGYSVKSLGDSKKSVVKLRSNIICTTIKSYKPDILLVDKKPFGIENELEATINYLHEFLPETKIVLLLRDILDDAEITQQIWKKNKYHEVIKKYYDLVLIAGMREVFDACKEYNFPSSTVKKVRFCGYVKRENRYNSASPESVKNTLSLTNEKLILVTVGGGEDGYKLLRTYLDGLRYLPRNHRTKSIIITGPELAPHQKQEILATAKSFPFVQIKEFTKNIESYMTAADLVISMGGYNTICEIFSLKKRAIVIPRVHPVQEQWIRAKHMSDLGLIRFIHPKDISAKILIKTVLKELDNGSKPNRISKTLDLNALPRMAQYITKLVQINPSYKNTQRTLSIA